MANIGHRETVILHFLVSLFFVSLCVCTSSPQGAGLRLLLLRPPCAAERLGKVWGEKIPRFVFSSGTGKKIFTGVVFRRRVDPDVCGGVPVRQQVEVHGAVAGGGAVRAGEADKQLD